MTDLVSEYETARTLSHEWVQKATEARTEGLTSESEAAERLAEHWIVRELQLEDELRARR
ncbi:MAG: hypothetical protein ABI885_08950 [Gammaproteobacteria bacterium]